MSALLDVATLATGALAGIGGALLGDRIGLWLCAVLGRDGRRP